jgi:hypothetical protein
MKTVLRYLVLFVVIVVGFYLMVTLFVVFAVLAAIGALLWLGFRLFGGNAKFSSTHGGVTIDVDGASDSANDSNTGYASRNDASKKADTITLIEDIRGTKRVDDSSDIELVEEFTVVETIDVSPIVESSTKDKDESQPAKSKTSNTKLVKEKANIDSLEAHFATCKKSAAKYCQSPAPELPTVVDDLTAIAQDTDLTKQMRAGAFRLLGEIHEANKQTESAIEHYQTALALDAKVGVKRKISQLQK